MAQGRSNATPLFFINSTRKCPLRGHILAPPEGLRAPEVPGVNLGGRPQQSGGDSKAIKAKKKFVRDERMDGRTDGQTDVIVEIVL